MSAFYLQVSYATAPPNDLPVYKQRKKKKMSGGGGRGRGFTAGKNPQRLSCFQFLKEKKGGHFY